MKNNNYDYKKLIEEFCNEKGYSDKQKSYLLKPCVYEKNLFAMMPYQYADLVVGDMCGLGNKSKTTKVKTKTPRYLFENYLYISHFFEWCVDKNIIPSNPYNEDYLSYDVLLYQFTQQLEITVLYEEDLPLYISKIDSNNELCGVILGFLFDGVIGNKELASIKYDDINGNILSIRGRNVILSHFSINALNKYRQVSAYYVEKSNGVVEEHPYIQYKDFLFKITDKFAKDLTDEKYIFSMGKSLGNNLNKLDISMIDVTRSGLIAALRKEFNKFSDKEFSDIFIKDDKINTGIAGKINKVMKTYGKTRVNEVINSCFSYIVKSKYYQT